MKIYMIRHCESEDDVLNCYGGCADFDLTEKGAETARNYSDKLVNLGIQKIYTSPYRRAKGVAKIFADKINCELEIVNDLRETNTYGVMSGVNKDLAKRIFSTLLKSDEYKAYGYYNGKPFYGGEAVAEFDNRIKSAFQYAVSQDNDIIVIVTHGGVFRSVYKNILNQSEKIQDMDDCATIEINYENGIFSIVSMSGTIIE